MLDERNPDAKDHVMYDCIYGKSFPHDSAIKNPLMIQETLVQSLGQRRSLDRVNGNHSSILVGKIIWIEAWQANGHRVSEVQ